MENTFIVNLIKFLPWIIFIINSLFLLRGFILLNGRTRIVTMSHLPQPFGMIYSIMKRIPIINKDLVKSKYDLFFILGTTKEEIIENFLCVYSSISVLITIDAAIISIEFVGTWYWCLIIIFFCITLPYLEITNSISTKAEALRIKNISCYQAAERFFSDGNQVFETFSLIESTTSGSIKRLYTNFKNSYFLKEETAYENYVRTVNNRYSLSFIKDCIAYSDGGIDPCDNIHRTQELAIHHYRVIRSTRSGCSGYRKLGVFMLVIIVGFAISSNQLYKALEGKTNAEFLTYISLVAVLFCSLISYIYERA